jgi:hypothetical protein
MVTTIPLSPVKTPSTEINRKHPTYNNSMGIKYSILTIESRYQCSSGTKISSTWVLLQQVYIDGKWKRTDLPCRCLLFPSMGLLCEYSSLVVYTQEQSTVTQNNQTPNNLIMTRKKQPLFAQKPAKTIS